MNHSAVAPLALAAVLLAGCTSFAPADARRGGGGEAPALPEAAWPPRGTAGLEAVIAAMPKTLHRTVAATAEIGGVPHALESRVPVQRMAFAHPYGQGVVRGLRAVGQDGRLLRPDAEPELQFLAWPVPGAEDAGGLADAQPIEDHFALAKPEGRAADGLAIVVGGSGDRPHVERVEAELRRRGFAVAALDPLDVADLAGEYTADSSAEIAAAARAIAEAIDTKIADKAYAAEALLLYLADRRPDLPPSPLVLIGCGHGAFAVPAMAARLQGKVAAVVLLGAGAPVFDAVRWGSATRDLLQLRGRSAPLSSVQETWASDLVLAAARLDPHHAARALAGTPVLHLFARFDEVVPHEACERLNDRLGRPDTVRILGRHDEFLEELEDEDRAAWIADWVERAVGRDPGSS